MFINSANWEIVVVVIYIYDIVHIQFDTSWISAPLDAINDNVQALCFI